MLILANSHELILGDWFDLGSWHQRQESMHFKNPIRAIGCSIRCVAGHERIGLAIKVACHIDNKRGPQSSPLTYLLPYPAFSGGRGCNVLLDQVNAKTHTDFGVQLSLVQIATFPRPWDVLGFDFVPLIQCLDQW